MICCIESRMSGSIISVYHAVYPYGIRIQGQFYGSRNLDVRMSIYVYITDFSSESYWCTAKADFSLGRTEQGPDLIDLRQPLEVRLEG